MESFILETVMDRLEQLSFFWNCTEKQGKNDISISFTICVMEWKRLARPYRQSAGYWNTTCLCCGPAGFVPLYVGLYYETGKERWKKLAAGVGEILLGTGTDEKERNTMKWELAFDRVAPEK